MAEADVALACQGTFAKNIAHSRLENISRIRPTPLHGASRALSANRLICALSFKNE